MDQHRFDGLTRRLGAAGSRRGLLKGLVGGLIGLAAAPALEQADAAGTATLTIHNATCAPGKAGSRIYDNCHANGFGCIDFFFRGRTLRTNAKGRATTSVGAGSLTIGQQTSRVSKSSGVFVYCAAQANGKTTRVLFNGRADTGTVTIAPRAGENVVCDWYNLTKQNLALPQQCPAAPTTPAPTTTTTTTTAIPCTIVPTGAGTLKDAIAAATAGDTLCLLEGDYTAKSSSDQFVAHINKNLTIKGAGVDKTIIDCEQLHGGLSTASATTVAISGLTVNNFEASNTLYIEGIQANGTITLTDILVDGSPYEGIVIASATSAVLTRVTIENCEWAALEAANSTVSLIDCLIDFNGTANGIVEGTLKFFNSTVTMDSDTVIDNNQYKYGGAVYLNGGSFTNNGGKITNNISRNSSVIQVENAGVFTNNGGTMTGNTSSTGALGHLNATTGSFINTNGTLSSNTGSCAGVYQESVPSCCTAITGTGTQTCLGS